MAFVHIIEIARRTSTSYERSAERAPVANLTPVKSLDSPDENRAPGKTKVEVAST